MYSRNEDVVWTQLGDRVLFCDLDSGEYFELRDIGAVIWGLLERPVGVEAIVSQIAAEYDVAADRCRADVRGFLDQLDKAGCLTVTEPAS